MLTEIISAHAQCIYLDTKILVNFPKYVTRA